jgi:DNA replication and repair protein RecF
VLLGLRLAASERKQTRVNGVLRTRAFDLVGQLLAVFFGSGELDIVAGEPSARRRFLDLSLSQVWPKYCLDLAHYKRVLEHRNRLLKEIRERPRADSGLDAWNEQLARYGAPMMERRKEFLERLAPKAAKHHFDISQKREELRVTYRPNVPVADLGTADGTAASFLDEIERRTAEEVTRGTTLVGPHRDDLELLIGSEGARAFGSQGQKRTVALALKLAELELMQEVAGEPPVLLLDDVFSDLDGQRRRSLLENAAGRCQTFLTCTSTRSLSEEILSGAHVFEVQGGSVAARE